MYKYFCRMANFNFIVALIIILTTYLTDSSLFIVLIKFKYLFSHIY